MKNKLIFHPFLFAIYPILSLFAYNIDQIAFSVTLTPLALSIGGTLILLVALRLIFKEYFKSALILSLFIGVFFLYGHVFSLIQAWLPNGFIIGKHIYLELIWLIFLALGIFFLSRTQLPLKQLTKILNIAALALVLVTIANITVYKLQHNPTRHEKKALNAQPILSGENSDKRRDIYYIVLDGYAHATTLKEVYNYDNRQFISFLTDHGFSVPAKSCSNYGMTFLSLAATLNMEYINYLADTVGKQSTNQAVPRSMISNNKVSAFLKSKGYKIIQLNSGWGPTKYNKHADLIVNTGRISNFEVLLCKTTMLAPWTKKIFGNGARERILNHFDQLAQVARIAGPKFIFAHIISPHPPYLFDANGRPVPKSLLNLKGNIWRQKDRYREQLIFINKKVQVLVKEIFKKSITEPIVIIQADHGTASRMYEPGSGGWNRPTPSKLRERLRIFSAFYLPGDAKNDLYDTLSPVNNFRFIFNHYLDGNFEMLEDRSYYSTYQLPYQFSDVTKQVAF
jgi:hypothetical protein